MKYRVSCRGSLSFISPSFTSIELAQKWLKARAAFKLNTESAYAVVLDDRTYPAPTLFWYPPGWTEEPETNEWGEIAP